MFKRWLLFHSAYPDGECELLASSQGPVLFSWALQSAWSAGCSVPEGLWSGLTRRSLDDDRELWRFAGERGDFERLRRPLLTRRGDLEPDRDLLLLGRLDEERDRRRAEARSEPDEDLRRPEDWRCLELDLERRGDLEREMDRLERRCRRLVSTRRILRPSRLTLSKLLRAFFMSE